MKTVKIEIKNTTAIFYCAKCKKEITRGFYMGITIPETCPHCNARIIEVNKNDPN